MPLFRSLALAAVLSLPPSAPQVAAADDLTTLLANYRCLLAEQIQRLHERGDPGQERGRYFVVSLPSGIYVQCHFYDRDRHILCEGYSGFYDRDPKGGRVYLPAKAVDALAALGFNRDDTKGNFQIEFATGEPPDTVGIATFVLKTLHAAYGAHGATRLTIQPPPSMEAFARQSCTPLS